MKQEEYHTISYIAVFGTLWGISEAVLGGFLHSINLPLNGTILTAIGTVILLTGARLLPVRKGFPLLYMGVIACTVKLFSMGIFDANIFISIIVESALLQICLSVAGYNIAGCLLGGVFACLWPLFSRMILYGFIFGKGLREMYVETIQIGNTLAGISLKSGLIILLVLAGVHIVIGFFAGYIGWASGRKLMLKKYGKT